MTLKDKIINELRLNNYQSDRELSDKILGKGNLPQPINSACRQLESEGIINRTSQPIKNYIPNGDVRAIPEGKSLLSTSSVRRGEYLKDEFNAFWNVFFKTDRDYYSEFSLNKLAELKMAVTNINNLITYRSTIMAAQMICDILMLNEDERYEIVSSIELTSVNSNGFDIEYRGRFPFVCEVKANIPAGGRDFFGAAQIKQLKKDIESLLNGKSKSNINSTEIQGYYKFLCLYCDNERTYKASKKFVSMSNGEYKDKLEFWSGQEHLEKDKVYIFFVVKEN